MKKLLVALMGLALAFSVTAANAVTLQDAASVTVTVQPYLSIGIAEAGFTFDILADAVPDVDGYRWSTVQTGNISGAASRGGTWSVAAVDPSDSNYKVVVSGSGAFVTGSITETFTVNIGVLDTAPDDTAGTTFDDVVELYADLNP